jgi:hypothetical protein
MRAAGRMDCIYGLSVGLCFTVVEMGARRLSTRFRRQPVTIRGAIVAAMIAGIFTVLVVLIELVVPAIAKAWHDSDLELVGASFEETAEATTLDINVRNTGEKVAYLREANFNVERTWELWSTIFPGRVPVSGNYDVTLTPDGTPYTKTVELSQSIDPNEVERYKFTFALNDRARAYSEKTNYVFLTTIDLVYDEDEKVVSSERFLFVRELPWQQAGSGVKSYFPYGVPGPVDRHQDPFFRAVRTHNAQVVDEISRVEGTKSQSLKKLIRDIPEHT